MRAAALGGHNFAITLPKAPMPQQQCPEVLNGACPISNDPVVVSNGFINDRATNCDWIGNSTLIGSTDCLSSAFIPSTEKTILAPRRQFNTEQLYGQQSAVIGQQHGQMSDQQSAGIGQQHEHENLIILQQHGHDNVPKKAPRKVKKKKGPNAPKGKRSAFVCKPPPLTIVVSNSGVNSCRVQIFR